MIEEYQSLTIKLADYFQTDIVRYKREDLEIEYENPREVSYLCEIGLPSRISAGEDVSFFFDGNIDTLSLIKGKHLAIGVSEFGLIAINPNSGHVCLVDGEDSKFINSSVMKMLECFQIYNKLHVDNPYAEYEMEIDDSEKIYSDRANLIENEMKNADSKAVHESVLWAFRLEEIRSGIL